jgi:hypothetical protein
MPLDLQADGISHVFAMLLVESIFYGLFGSLAAMSVIVLM